MQDLRLALRLFAKAPVFTLIAVLSLALGLGANTAIFSLVNAVLLKTLPVRQPEQLVSIGSFHPKVRVVHGSFSPGMNNDAFSLPVYEALRDHTPALAGIAARSRSQVTIRLGETSERALAEVVSGNYFSMLGVRSALGRLLLPGDDREGAPPVCAISHGYWQRAFGSDRSIAGRMVQINGQAFTIAGVAAPEFHGFDLGQQSEIYVPLAMHRLFDPAGSRIDGKEISWLHLIGRLKTSNGMKGARAATDAAYHRIVKDRTGEETPERIVFASAAGGADGYQREHRTTLLLLMAAEAIVLLTACANVANLLLSRAASRRKEIAVRLALGASRARLIRQLLSESLLLSLAGGLLGLGLAVLFEDRLSALILRSRGVYDSLRPGLDGGVLAFNLGVSILVGLLFGLAPAIASTRPRLAPALKGTADDAGISRLSLRNGLVVVQVALSMVLLVGAALLCESLLKIRAADLGFAPQSLSVFRVSLGDQGYSPAAAATFVERLAQQLENSPGVRAASYANISPMSGNMSISSFGLPGKPFTRESNQLAYRMNIGPGFFSTIGTPLLEGREFTARDREGAPAVAVVNEYMARQFWPGESAIGKQVIFDRPVEVVGVVRDSKYQRVTEKDHFTVFTPMLASPVSGATFHVRGEGDIRPILAGVRRQVPVFGVRTMHAQIEEGLMLERMLSAVSIFFGALALLLSGIGLYGVIAYAVTRRTREIGIRMALGAQRSDVLKNVLRESALLALAGVLAGIPAAIAASRWVASYLYGLSATDPRTYAAIGTGLLVVGLWAGVMPARRATQVDPVVALRQD